MGSSSHGGSKEELSLEDGELERELGALLEEGMQEGGEEESQEKGEAQVARRGGQERTAAT
eukprot:10785201-Alexandrium_andersonii.AAC.1